MFFSRYSGIKSVSSLGIDIFGFADTIAWNERRSTYRLEILRNSNNIRPASSTELCVSISLGEDLSGTATTGTLRVAMDNLPWG